MKKFTSLMLCLATIATSVSVVACSGGNVTDTPETLQIYAWEAGYGTQWCKDLVEKFKEQDWVKEKYPNLNIPEVYVNDQETFASDQLDGGESVNSYDLLFGSTLQDLGGESGDLLNLTESVYNSDVPGESIKYKDKILGSYLASNKYVNTADYTSEEYYVASWAGGMDGIVYNATILEQMGIKVPNTTDELIAACAEIKANESQNNGKYNKGFSFIQSKDTNYWEYLFPIWWAQYEGKDKYLDFYNGKDGNRLSREIFNQKGREYALGVYEELLAYDNGYLSNKSFDYDFLTAQQNFLQGYGVFHVNGDWFDNEMRDTAESLGITDTFKMMRLPIISELGVKLGITDAQLSATVDYVDGVTTTKPTYDLTDGYTSTDYTEEEVIAAVKEARSFVQSIGPNHTAIIPEYATGKEVAVDFLRFMATDIAQETYIQSTGGASLPFNYNLKEKNVQLYNSLGALQKERHDYFYNGKFEIYTLPSENSFPLASVSSGLRPFVNTNYYEVFTKQGNQKTPADFMTETINAWADDAKWNSLLQRAGITG